MGGQDQPAFYPRIDTTLRGSRLERSFISIQSPTLSRHRARAHAHVDDFAFARQRTDGDAIDAIRARADHVAYITKQRLPLSPDFEATCGHRRQPSEKIVGARLSFSADASRFPSRETIPRRPPRIYRTGRTMQFNARATPETVEAFYAIADQQRWLISEALEHALAALKRELAGQGG